MNQLPLWVVKYIYIGIGLAYFILPWDFDMAGMVGRIDDLAVMAFLYYRYQQHKKNQSLEDSHGTHAHHEDSNDQEKPEDTGPADPYDTLGVDRDDTIETIEKRYKELARQYHPDRVNHLGPELQEMAHQKMLAIQDAYERLKKHHRPT